MQKKEGREREWEGEREGEYYEFSIHGRKFPIKILNAV